MFISILYQLTGYLLILYLQLGVAALIGSIIFFVTIPLQTIIAKRQAMFQKNIMVSMVYAWKGLLASGGRGGGCVWVCVCVWSILEVHGMIFLNGVLIFVGMTITPKV